ncbi:hypothetical protein EI94DRAFT_1119830 [Lactarius quietus]|nr:hypothetical protein EI94DRAFT_1119830 [Lactarius quietus]
MSYIVALVISFLAALSVASPVVRQLSDAPCQTVDVRSFTLAAVPNSDSTTQLFLSVSGGSDPVTPLATSESQNVTAGPIADLFQMADGGITTIIRSSGIVLSTSLGVSTTNGLLNFQFAADSATFAVEVYCEVDFSAPQGSQYFLAVNGDASNFSLCTSDSGEDVVVYNAQEDGSEDAGFDFTTCSGVSLQIIPGSSADPRSYL